MAKIVEFLESISNIDGGPAGEPKIWRNIFYHKINYKPYCKAHPKKPFFCQTKGLEGFF